MDLPPGCSDIRVLLSCTHVHKNRSHFICADAIRWHCVGCGCCVATLGRCYFTRIADLLMASRCMNGIAAINGLPTKSAPSTVVFWASLVRRPDTVKIYIVRCEYLRSERIHSRFATAVHAIGRSSPFQLYSRRKRRDVRLPCIQYRLRLGGFRFSKVGRTPHCALRTETLTLCVKVQTSISNRNSDTGHTQQTFLPRTLLVLCRTR